MVADIVTSGLLLTYEFVPKVVIMTSKVGSAALHPLIPRFRVSGGLLCLLHRLAKLKVEGFGSVENSYKFTCCMRDIF